MKKIKMDNLMDKYQENFENEYLIEDEKYQDLLYEAEIDLANEAFEDRVREVAQKEGISEAEARIKVINELHDIQEMDDPEPEEKRLCKICEENEGTILVLFRDAEDEMPYTDYICEDCHERLYDHDA